MNRELTRRLIEAVREADRAFEKEGGSTNHYVLYCLLPVLEAAGLDVVEMGRGAKCENDKSS